VAECNIHVSEYTEEWLQLSVCMRAVDSRLWVELTLF